MASRAARGAENSPGFRASKRIKICLLNLHGGACVGRGVFAGVEHLENHATRVVFCIEERHATAAA